MNMPRGVPKAGYRKTVAAVARQTGSDMLQKVVPMVVVQNETDEEIEARLAERFDILSELTDAAIKGHSRALVVSGPAGLGKSYTVEEKLQDWDPDSVNHTIVKGYVRPTGLYRLLYQHRMASQVIVFDDADAIFFDDVSLNLLKAVCDTTERRVVSYMSEKIMVDEDEAVTIPKSFEFKGTIIFITNLDFDQMIEKGHKAAPHMQALVSRSHYIDLAMKTRRDYMVRIKQVVKQGLLGKMPKAQQDDVMAFLDKNQDKLRELSLRMAIKVAAIRKLDKPNWMAMAKATCCKL
jgi:hypothetical protein